MIDPGPLLGALDDDAAAFCGQAEAAAAQQTVAADAAVLHGTCIREIEAVSSWTVCSRWNRTGEATYRSSRVSPTV
jgi:hypothetical protein